MFNQLIKDSEQTIYGGFNFTSSQFLALVTFGQTAVLDVNVKPTVSILIFWVVLFSFVVFAVLSFVCLFVWFFVIVILFF